MKKPLYVVAGAVVVVLLVTVIFNSKHDPAGYNQEIIREREAIHTFMAEDPVSPFKLSAYTFKGLKYYPPDERYRVTASLEPITDKKIRTLENSDNSRTEYLEYAWAKFSLRGAENRLLILESTEPGEAHGTLFLAFIDSTSANETYGAGRYLELKKVPAMTSVVLDFNKAKNPYCAYVDRFACPFPPRENILMIAIKAGEKNYH